MTSSGFKKRATDCLYANLTEDQRNDDTIVSAIIDVGTVQQLQKIIAACSIDVASSKYRTVRHYQQWLTEIENRESEESEDITSPLIARNLSLSSVKDKEFASVSSHNSHKTESAEYVVT